MTVFAGGKLLGDVPHARWARGTYGTIVAGNDVLRHKGRWRSRTYKAPVQGAFKTWDEAVEEEKSRPRGRRAGSAAPRGDGLAYEKTIDPILLPSAEEREDMVWFPATPYMNRLLREVITKLQEVGGLQGSRFLTAIDADDFGWSRDIDGMSGMGVASLLGAARRSLDTDFLLECGWNDDEFSP